VINEGTGQYDNVFTFLNGYHSGIGFRNLNSGYSMTVNFDAVPSFTGSVIPEVSYQASGEPELLWSDYGGVLIYTGINMTFWAYGSEEVANITGSNFNSLLSWFVTYNSSNPYYNVWSVHTQYPLQPWDRTWIASHDCFAFVWEAYGYLTTLGVHFKVKSGRQSVMALLSPTEPIKMDMNNPIEKLYVISFYRYLLYQIEVYGPTAILTIVSELLYEERMIIRVDGEYYMVKPWSPFFDTYYVNEPYPPYN